jgi:hypothetical protein
MARQVCGAAVARSHNRRNPYLNVIGFIPTVVLTLL